MRAEVLEHDRRAGRASSGPTVASAVDHVVAGIATGAEHLARAGDDLDPAAQAHETRGDRRRRLDRDLERLGVVCAGEHVEHDRGARPPARFVLADHELAGARGRAPVHAAQVVAELVLAQRQELVAEVAHHRARRRAPRCSALMRLPTATGATMSCTRGRTTSSASPALGIAAARETERIGHARPTSGPTR